MIGVQTTQTRKTYSTCSQINVFIVPMQDIKCARNAHVCLGYVYKHLCTDQQKQKWGANWRDGQRTIAKALKGLIRHPRAW